MLESADVYGTVNVGRKGYRSEWLDASLSKPIEEKKVAHGRMKQNGSEINRREYKERSSVS